jgi:hypothetical protein
LGKIVFQNIEEIVSSAGTRNQPRICEKSSAAEIPSQIIGGAIAA